MLFQKKFLKAKTEMEIQENKNIVYSEKFGVKITLKEHDYGYNLWSLWPPTMHFILSLHGCDGNCFCRPLRA